MKYDLSILIPSIRTNNWASLIVSLHEACKKYTCELVFIGPFEDFNSCAGCSNIYPRHIEEFGCVSRAVQRGMLETLSDLVFLTVDDCVFAEDSIDKCIEQYREECGEVDVLNMRYSEGGDIWPAEKYRVGAHGSFQLPGIDQNWNLAGQFIMKRSTFIGFGGIDCRYEYSNEGVNDLIFRMQRFGSKVINSHVHCCIATHYPGETKDHGPIHRAQISHDYPTFVNYYRSNNGNGPIFIDYDNWQQQPDVWERRFSRGKKYTYQELAESEGYSL